MRKFVIGGSLWTWKRNTPIIQKVEQGLKLRTGDAGKMNWPFIAIPVLTFHWMRAIEHCLEDGEFTSQEISMHSVEHTLNLIY
jgi:hypothetical protein